MVQIDDFETCDVCKKTLNKLQGEDFYVEEIGAVFCAKHYAIHSSIVEIDGVKVIVAENIHDVAALLLDTTTLEFFKSILANWFVEYVDGVGITLEGNPYKDYIDDLSAVEFAVLALLQNCIGAERPGE